MGGADAGGTEGFFCCLEFDEEDERSVGLVVGIGAWGFWRSGFDLVFFRRFQGYQVFWRKRRGLLGGSCETGFEVVKRSG